MITLSNDVFPDAVPPERGPRQLRPNTSFGMRSSQNPRNRIFYPRVYFHGYRAGENRSRSPVLW